MWSAGPGDDQARFLSDLRTLRDAAAIGYDELAARAHFPSGVLKEAENGPVLPSLPILTAYVRACDGNVPEWEERWRQLTSEIPEDPDLPVRPAGASAAAVAGARAGVGIAPPEVHDPERIKAALRGGLARSGNGGSSAIRDAGARAKAASGWGANPGWDGASDDTITIANGNHSPASWSREPFETSVETSVEPDPVPAAELDDPFRWLPEEESVSSVPGGEPADSYGVDARIAEVGSDMGSDHPSLTDPAGIESAVTEWAPRWDDAGRPAEGTDFWSAAAPAAEIDTEADLVRPAAAPQPDDESAYAETSWSAAVARSEAAAARAETAAPVRPAATSARYPVAAETAPSVEAATATPPRTYAGFTGSDSAPAAASTGSTATAGSTEPTAAAASTGSTATAGSTEPTATAAQAPSHQTRSRQRDRLFPAQLLVIIVIAALIGSLLVLLLK
jgi:hypothetical protein